MIYGYARVSTDGQNLDAQRRALYKPTWRAPQCQRLDYLAAVAMTGETGTAARVKDLLATVKPLAAELFRLTSKPLGVTELSLPATR